MTNKELFKQAIADAKAVREVALANAKAAIEETLQPRIQSMLQAKLQEMEELDEVEDDTDEVKENFDAVDENSDQDLDLNELLAELELDETEDNDEDDKAMYEAKEEDEEGEEEENEEGGEGEVEGGEGGESITDLTVDELKDIIKDIISAEMGGGAPEMEPPADEEGGEELDFGGEDMGSEGGEDEEINLEELLAELDALDESDDSLEEAKKKSKHEKGESAKEEKEEHKSGKEKKEKDEMKEALDTIEVLRSELNEVNLLNAKLLYVNKIFKAKNLTESQKIKVLEAFDEATNVKETKLVYESLSKTLATSSNTTSKTNIKENLGFASKPAGVAPKKQIVEVNDAVSRMQLLAGIKK